jgi:hypothetical protein
LTEFFEDTLVILGRDTRTRVGDCDTDLASRCGNGNTDVTICRSVPERIADQVLDHPANQAYVDRNRLGWLLHADRHRAITQGLGCSHYCAKESVKVARFALQLHLACPHFANVEDGADHVEQIFGAKPREGEKGARTGR